MVHGVCFFPYLRKDKKMKKIVSITVVFMIMMSLTGCTLTGDSLKPIIIDNASVPCAPLVIASETSATWETISIPRTTLYVTRNASLRNIPDRSGTKIDSVNANDEISVIGMVTTFNGEDCYFFLLEGEDNAYIDGRFVTAR